MQPNFLFLDYNARITEIADELERNKALWNMVSQLEGTAGDLKPPGFLPLAMGVQEPGKRIKDSEGVRATPAAMKFPALFKELAAYGFTGFARCAFFKLAVGGGVRTHIDDGSYYIGKDRFHLCIQGKYEYQCADEIKIIEAGNLFWFDNKKLHRALNVDTIERLTFVFDVPYAISPIRNSDGTLKSNDYYH